MQVACDFRLSADSVALATITFDTRPTSSCTVGRGTSRCAALPVFTFDGRGRGRRSAGVRADRRRLGRCRSCARGGQGDGREPASFSGGRCHARRGCVVRSGLCVAARVVPRTKLGVLLELAMGWCQHTSGGLRAHALVADGVREGWDLSNGRGPGTERGRRAGPAGPLRPPEPLPLSNQLALDKRLLHATGSSPTVVARRAGLQPPVGTAGSQPPVYPANGPSCSPTLAR